MTIPIPPLDPRVRWSVQVVDTATEKVLAEHEPDAVCETASIGKVFLLIEVARRLGDGRLRADQRIEIPAEHAVADSGLLYRMLDQRLTVHDAALLVGAVSDNLATNALISLCGLDDVRVTAVELGYRDTSLHDYIRDERTPEMPWTPSYGTARELADLMRRLGAHEIISPAVSTQVFEWLAADTDTSMLADAFLLDPLAHPDAEYQDILLRHKTGSTSFARIDIGWVQGPVATVAYAIAANWKDRPEDLRAPAIDSMRILGEAIRAHITGQAREAGER